MPYTVNLNTHNKILTILTIKITDVNPVVCWNNKYSKLNLQIWAENVNHSGIDIVYSRLINPRVSL